jgi:hypothetical protein
MEGVNSYLFSSAIIFRMRITYKMNQSL